MKVDKRIGARELIAMLSFLVGTKLADMTPTLLAQEGKNGFWMIPIVSFLAFFPSFLVLLYLLNKYEDKNLYDLIQHLLGKVLSKIICIWQEKNV